MRRAAICDLKGGKHMKHVIFLYAAALLPSAVSCTVPDAGRPNIILIYADDLGIGDIGCYGQQYIRTPFLDRMAAEGIVFTNHYSGSAVSAPSRSCLMTGQHSGHTVIRANKEMTGNGPSRAGQFPLPSDGTTMASMLENAGYATGIFGKWGLGSMESSGNPLKQGFDTFFGFADQKHAHNHYPSYLFDGNDTVNTGSRYALDLFFDKAADFITKNRNRPFFVYLAVTVPHRALQVPEEELAQYDTVFTEVPYSGDDGYLPHAKPKAAYAGMISRLDRKTGEIMDLLDSLGLSENTLLMFSSDNGPCSIGGVDTYFFNSNAGLSGAKRSLKEGGIRVPMIARWPGKINPGRKTDLLSAQYDYMATFAELTGCDVPDGTDGISFAPTLFGERQAEKHEFLYWEYIEQGGQQAVRIGNLKAYRKGLLENTDVQWELYDLERDPEEKYDLSYTMPETVFKVDSIARSQHSPAVLPEWEIFGNKHTEKNTEP